MNYNALKYLKQTSISFRSINAPEEVAISKELLPTSAGLLLENYQELNKPVIDGLLRRAEIMNIIASPKAGKSWLVIALAIAVARGTPWLSYFQTVQGKVLLIDNELHKGTFAHRLRTVLKEMEIDPVELKDHFEVLNLRGALEDIDSISGYLNKLKPGEYSLIIFDAWYRVLPKDVDENNNGEITQLYNKLDLIAEKTQAAIVLIHHSSKGNQAGKSVTDMGSGAGAQSRAADSHLTLRKHKEGNAIVLDAVARSWKPPEPIVIELDFPIWRLLQGMDPKELDTGSSYKKDKEKKWNKEIFLDEFFEDEPIDYDLIIDEASEAGISERQTLKFLNALEKSALLYVKKVDKCKLYSRHPIEDNKDLTKKELVLRALGECPNLSSPEIAKRCNCSEKYVRQIRSGTPPEQNGPVPPSSASCSAPKTQ